MRLEDPLPSSAPWFDGSRVELVAARGETVGFQVVDRAGGSVSLAIAAGHVQVRGYLVDAFVVRRASTALYGGSRGTGTYLDGLTPTAGPLMAPAYLEVVVDRDATPGSYSGELRVGTRPLPVTLTILPVTLPPLDRNRVWAYEDPRELAWQRELPSPRQLDRDPDRSVPSDQEQQCTAVFAARGVLLSPDLQLAWWPARRAQLADIRNVPVVIPTEPAAAAVAVRGWIEALAGTAQVPFAIPIDEPRTPEARVQVRTLAAAVRAAGGGPSTFQYAVTDAPHADYGDLVDLYISWRAVTRGARQANRWTYNGAPPYAGAMVLDALAPGTRTWGWIAWLYDVPVWYVWDALYWHDRHNRKRSGAPRPGRALDPRVDPVSFFDGEDAGNLDGVLALPSPDGCRPTLRLAALHRGQQDRQLLELAAACAPAATAARVAALLPTALGDAPTNGPPSWPTDDATWEQARRDVLALALPCARPVAQPVTPSVPVSPPRP